MSFLIEFIKEQMEVIRDRDPAMKRNGRSSCTLPLRHSGITGRVTGCSGCKESRGGEPC